MSTEREAIRAMHGLDASRRVGWARYYEAVEHAGVNADAALRWLIDALAFAHSIVYHDRLAADDPLVLDAMDLVAAIEATAEGRRISQAVQAVVLRKGRT